MLRYRIIDNRKSSAYGTVQCNSNPYSILYHIEEKPVKYLLRTQ